jgi:hypothetical protein
VCTDDVCDPARCAAGNGEHAGESQAQKGAPSARSLLQAAALRYAATGWPVFLLSHSKRPLANCDRCRSANGMPPHDPEACGCLTCHGFYAATTEAARIEAMFGLPVRRPMLAVRTGAPSGLVLVDADAKAGGLESLRRMIAHGLCPPTAWAATGGGGVHLFYRHPGGSVPGSQGKLAPGIDIKADGGYGILAPSAHPVTGRAYAWQRREPLTEMAPQLAERIAELAEATAASFATPAGPATITAGSRARIAHPDRLMRALAQRIAAAPEGRRRTILWGCARGAARIVAAGHLSAEQARAQLLAACDSAQWPRTKSTPQAIADGFAHEGVIW